MENNTLKTTRIISIIGDPNSLTFTSEFTKCIIRECTFEDKILIADATNTDTLTKYFFSNKVFPSNLCLHFENLIFEDEIDSNNLLLTTLNDSILYLKLGDTRLGLEFCSDSSFLTFFKSS